MSPQFKSIVAAPLAFLVPAACNDSQPESQPSSVVDIAEGADDGATADALDAAQSIPPNVPDPEELERLASTSADLRSEGSILASLVTEENVRVYFVEDEVGGLLILRVGKDLSAAEWADVRAASRSPLDLFLALAPPHQEVPDALVRYSATAEPWDPSSVVHQASGQITAAPDVQLSSCGGFVTAEFYDWPTNPPTIEPIDRRWNPFADNTRDAGETSTWTGNDKVSAAGHICIVDGFATFGFQKQNWNGGGWSWLVDGVLLHDGDAAEWFYSGQSGNDDFNFQSYVYFFSDTHYQHDAAACRDYWSRTVVTSCFVNQCRLRDAGGVLPNTSLGCTYKGPDPSNIFTPITDS